MKITRRQLRKLILKEMRMFDKHSTHVASRLTKMINDGLGVDLPDLPNITVVDSSFEGDVLYLSLDQPVNSYFKLWNRINTHLMHTDPIVYNDSASAVNGCKAFISPAGENGLKVFYWDCPDDHEWANESWEEAVGEDFNRQLKNPR